MPKQNRPLVRDGRLQAKKKRTDRSYLRPNGASTAPAAPDEAEAAGDFSAADDAPVGADASAVSDIAAGKQEPAREMAAAPARAASAPAGRLPSSVRAIQQQGVRKRRELDVQSLAERDSRYALHELRRIFILTALVIVTLVVLTFVLR